jgi:hypothetical protein
MFSFVAVFGRGDLMEWGLRKLGGRGGGGPTVATLHGQKISYDELRQLGEQRRLASNFLLQVAWQNHRIALQELLKKELKDNPGPDDPLASVRLLALEAEQRTNPSSQVSMFARIGRLFSQPESNFLAAFNSEVRAIDSRIQQDLVLLQRVATAEKVKDDPGGRLQVIDSLVTILSLQRWILPRIPALLPYLQTGRPLSSDEFYLGGTRKPDELLDFVMWRWHADRLGITLTDSDVIREVNREAAHRDAIQEKQFQNDRLVIDFIRNNRESRNFGPTQLLNALRDEFRVAMVQGALLGREPGVRGERVTLELEATPALATPDEFLRYYRDQRTTLKVAMLRLPVDKYVAEVKGSPTEQELRNRYEAYKEQEFNPRQRDPGFREPHRIAIEYVSASPQSDYYKQEAQKQAQALNRLTAPLEALSFRMGAMAGLVHPGASQMGWAAQVGSVLALDPLASVYEQEVVANSEWFTSENEGALAHEKKIKRLHESSLAQPGNVAALLGSLSAASLGNGGALAAPATLYGSATFPEVRGSLRYNAALVLGMANLGPGQDAVGQMMRAAALVAPYQAEVPPLERFRERLLMEMEQRLAVNLIEDNFATMRNDLATARAKAGSSPKAQTEAAEKYLKEAVAKYHLKKEGPTKPMSRLEFIDAQENKQLAILKPLEEAYRASNASMAQFLGIDLSTGGFVNALFGQSLSPQFRLPSPFGTVLYEPTTAVHTDNPTVYYMGWRAVDQPARTPPFEEVRGQVEAAWKFEKAREEARRSADQIRETIRSQPNPEDAVRVLREQKQGEVFELDRVSKLVSPDREVHALMGTDYRPYQIPEDKRAFIPYPPYGLVDGLLTLTKPGEALVLPDQPVRNFYVAVLQGRDEPSVQQFLALYAKTAMDDPLYARFLQDQDRRYRTRILLQLRREAQGLPAREGGLGAKESQYQIPEDLRKRLEGGGGDVD